MLTLPAKTRRRKQPYVSLRSQLSRRNLRRVGILLYSELRNFIEQRGIEDAGPGFLRYLSIGANSDLDVEFGYFTGSLHPGAGPVRSGLLPGGLFISARWTGAYENLPDAEAMMAGWTSQCNIPLDATETPLGVNYGCRLAIFHVSPRHTEDETKLVTELAVLTRSADARA
jgi:effector-binding domain-containing protein